MSVAVVLLTLLLLAAAIAVISRPLLAERDRNGVPNGAQPDRSDANREREENTGRGAGEPTELDVAARKELEAAREAKYREIRDTELDYRTGKLSREDFDAVNATLRAEAVAILDRLSALEDASTGVS